MKLIESSDPQYFEQTSDKPYCRHLYKLVDNNGKSIVVDNWQDAGEIWWNTKVFLSHIEVIDIESKGFK